VPWQVTDSSGAGNIQTSWSLSANDPGPTFRLIAIGQSSGDVAIEDFTDASTLSSISPTSGPEGAIANTTLSSTITGHISGASITVASTTGFPSPAGSISITNTAGVSQTFTYTGTTATSFTGVTGGVAGTNFASGNLIQQAFASTTLSASASPPGVTTLTVASTVGFPSVGQLTIGSWTITYTGTTATTFTGCIESGGSGTLASGSPVTQTPGFTLSATGTGYSTSSKIQLNSTAVTTIFVSATSLRAIVPASFMSDESATPISVTVSTGGVAKLFTVKDATLINYTPTSTINAFEGSSTATLTLATFFDPNPGDHHTDFTATVNWNDGSTADTVAVSYLGSNRYTVTDSHTYSNSTGDLQAS
jgi:hypothetical protein